jgi:plasmid stability protein
MCATLIHVPTRNITFKLPSELLKKAKVYAAEHDTTVNGLVRELLEQKLSWDEKADAAARRILAIAKAGPYFSADLRSIPRDSIYER